jgi:PPOX class probable F420-dependent enzyme
MTSLGHVRDLAAREHGLAVVATLRADGSAPASVVNAGVFDHPVSGVPVVAFVARGSTRKLANLRVRPRATVVFRVGWEWAAVEGAAELLGPDDALLGFDPGAIPQLLRDVFTAAGGTHDDWDEYDRVMAAEHRTAVFVHPERVYANPA